MNRRIYSFVLLGISCLPVSAQVDHAAFSGTVTDPSGALVQGAKVETVSGETGLHRQTVTGSAGTYQIPGLPISIYTVTVSQAGFQTLEYKRRRTGGGPT